MKPDKDGDVFEEWLPKDRRYRTIKEMRYPMRRYGKPLSTLRSFLDDRKSKGAKHCPTQIWITSLCSYWFEAVAQTCRVIRESGVDASIVLIGNYPRFMPDHACNACDADLAVTKNFEVDDSVSAFDLYGDAPPPFVAVGLNPKTAIQEISDAVKRGVNQVAFFTEDLCQDGGKPLIEIVGKTKGLHRHLRFHAICGLKPSGINADVARCLVDKSFSEFHFEEESTREGIDLDAYHKARSYLEKAGLKLPDDRMSGFVWIGRPKEVLEEVILKSFTVVEACGGVILKPFSPIPGSPEQQEICEHRELGSIEAWSPHFFPFAELNGITRSEYHDLYRMAAFLNEKVRNRAFDFLKGTLGAEMLRDSLAREVWNLEPSPIRITD